MKTENSKVDFQYCQKLQIEELPEDTIDLYNNFQEDYKKIIKFLVENSGCGYCLRDEDRTIIEPIKCPDPVLTELIDIIGKGGLPASNAYAVIYTNHAPNTKVRKDCKAGKYIGYISNNRKEKKEFSEEEPKQLAKQYPAINEETWAHLRNRYLNGESFDSLWKEVCPKLETNRSVRIATEVRNKGTFPKVKKDKDYHYCTALFDMVKSSFNSWVKNHKEHQDKIENTKKLLGQEIKKCKENLYNCFLEFCDKLGELNYGISAKVLKTFFKIREGKENKEEYHDIPYGLFSSNKILMESSENDLFAAYKAVKIYRKLSKMQKYIFSPNLDKDYQVPFGLTGKNIPFCLSCKNDKLTVVLGGCKFETKKSHYFSDISIVRNNNEFLLRFRNKLKSKKKNNNGKWIESSIKEIKIQKRNGKYYLYIPFSISHSSDNFLLERFFMKSFFDKNEKKDTELFDKLSKEIVVVGIDMNISTPLTATKALLKKENNEKEIKCLYFGSGKIISQPSIICDNTKLSGELRNFYTKIEKLKDYIKMYKTSAKNGIEIVKTKKEWFEEQINLFKSAIKNSENDKDKKWLKYENESPDDIRFKIQTLISLYKKEFEKLKYRCRMNGHNFVAENIQLIRVMDIFRSLIISFYSTDFRSEKKKETKEKNKFFGLEPNNKRANFRLYATKKFAAEIVKVADGANIVFVEDLDFEFDRDNNSNSNSLARLFASGQLKKWIKSSLNKIGIGCVFVAPELTSKTDPVTGLLGYRDKGKNKENLYVLRDGNLGVINSDVAASLNVLLAGVNHSVYQRRLFIKNGKVSSKKESKRLNSFIKERNLDSVLFQVDSVAEKVVASNVSTTRDTIQNGIVYITPDGFITENQKEGKEKKIKDMVTFQKDIPEFSLNVDDNRPYRGFSVKQMLDLP